MPQLEEPAIIRLPVNKLFVDHVHHRIRVGNITQPHGAEGAGYQRDPYARLKWITPRAENYDIRLARPIEVSKRGDGLFAVVDGGGRWVMAQIANIPELDCRVHIGLSRKEEAKLFVKLDRETYHLRAIDQFLAALGAKNEIAVRIDEAIKPYNVEKAGRGNLDFPGLLGIIYGDEGTGVRLLRKTSLIIANTWGKYSGGEFAGAKIPVAAFAAVAVVIHAANSHFDEGALRELLKSDKGSLRALEQSVKKHINGSKGALKNVLPDKARVGASALAKAYNTRVRAGAKIDMRALAVSELLDAIEAGGGSRIAFGDFLRSVRLR